MEPTPLFPLARALFPDGVLHLRIFEVRYLDMIKKCIADGSGFGVVPLLEGSEVRVPGASETLAQAGTMARIEAWEAPMPALLQLRCLGVGKFRLAAPRQLRHGLWVGETEPVPSDTPVELPPGLQAAADALGRFIASLQRGGVAAAEMPIAPPFRLDECGWVADRWAELLPLPPQRKQELLLQEDPAQRLREMHAELDRRGLLAP
ncbi:LON peptidase substrate-binding domain-containing protein [Pigmentiphaga soli]|uniref:LON peptidase substrate-binding domain-containing protein n=1 Tax=Pigmentiphaga soli TaxID=1007095 RepID=A0ABP8GHF0_9BURK